MALPHPPIINPREVNSGRLLCSPHMPSGGNQDHGHSRTAWGIREGAALSLPGDT